MIELESVSKIREGKTLFSKVSQRLSGGQLVFVVGETGCGKTTLLNMLAGKDHNYTGSIYFQNQQLPNPNPQSIAWIQQHFPLIAYYTIEENIRLFQDIDFDRFKDVITQLEINDLLKQFPHQLSGGEKQRVAIARALLRNAPLILADEPTSCLDVSRSKTVFDLLQKQAKKSLVIIVTHQRNMSHEYADIIWDMDQQLWTMKERDLSDCSHEIFLPSKWNYREFFIKQLRIWWSDKKRFLFGFFLWVFVCLVSIIGFHFFHSFSQHLQQEQAIRLDKNYFYIQYQQPKDNQASEPPFLQERKAVRLRPYSVLLNDYRNHVQFYYQNEPQYHAFYFEIIPLQSLTFNEVMVNQQFLQSGENSIDQIYFQIQHEDQRQHIVLSITNVVNEGTLYQTPKVYVSYAWCQQRWPDFDTPYHEVFFIPSTLYLYQDIQQITSLSFRYHPLANKNDTYYYSTYLLQQLQHDLSRVYRPLALWLLVSFGGSMVLFQGLLCLYLFDYRRVELGTYQENNVPRWMQIYLVIQDEALLGFAGFIVALFLYGFVVMSGFLGKATWNLHFFHTQGIVYTLIFLLLLVGGVGGYLMMHLLKKEKRPYGFKA